MGEGSKISWTANTWNPWQGCIKISPGCKNCYMYRDKERYGQDPKDIHRSSASTFNAPIRWNSERRGREASRVLVFTCSWSDWFLGEADEWRPEAWKIIKDTPLLTYQILTKRPELIQGRLPPDWGDGYPNVWLGISAEDEKHYQLRAPILERVPARVKFVSYEPALGPLVTGAPFIPLPGWWYIVGGESGPNARPFDLEWAREVIEACKGVAPVFVKQLGQLWAKQNGARRFAADDPAEWPEWLRVQEFPR